MTDLSTTTVQGGSLTSDTLWITTPGSTTTITNVGTSQIRPGQPILAASPAPIGDMLTLMKTADGEFVLNGSGDTLGLLMDYFLQSPEMWLRLAAMQPEKDA